MKIIYKTITLTILTISSLFASGQETVKPENPKKIKEYFVSLSSFIPLNISIKYKRQLRTKTFLKIGLVDLAGSSTAYSQGLSSTYPIYNTSYSIGLECGFEFRKSLNEKFTFFHGPNLSYTYQTQISKTDNPALLVNQRESVSQTFIGGALYTVGLLYQFSDHFLISAEINPSVFYSFRIFENGQSPEYNYTNNSIYFSLSNKFGIVSIAYRL
ncbi:MAG: hypothetical protein H0W84_03235 [Bacteroidetes bacterium]|nr:hypothetical protein [Bacteroidota bacterium]